MPFEYPPVKCPCHQYHPAMKTAAEQASLSPGDLPIILLVLHYKTITDGHHHQTQGKTPTWKTEAKINKNSNMLEINTMHRKENFKRTIISREEREYYITSIKKNQTLYKRRVGIGKNFHKLKSPEKKTLYQVWKIK